MFALVRLGKIMVVSFYHYVYEIICCSPTKDAETCFQNGKGDNHVMFRMNIMEWKTLPHTSIYLYISSCSTYNHKTINMLIMSFRKHMIASILPHIYIYTYAAYVNNIHWIIRDEIWRHGMSNYHNEILNDPDTIL